MNHWITFMNSRFYLLLFRPLCSIKKGPNMNCDCITTCREKRPYENIIISYVKVKCLPKHSRFSEDNKIHHQI